MECDKCMNEQRLTILEEANKKNSETHEKFYNRFEEVKTDTAVREERDKATSKDISNIFLAIGDIRTSIAEIQSRPIKQSDKIWDKIVGKIIDFIAIAVVGYVVFMLK
jgi:hypothetical protein